EPVRHGPSQGDMGIGQVAGQGVLGQAEDCRDQPEEGRARRHGIGNSVGVRLRTQEVAVPCLVLEADSLHAPGSGGVSKARSSTRQLVCSAKSVDSFAKSVDSGLSWTSGEAQ